MRETRRGLFALPSCGSSGALALSIGATVPIQWKLNQLQRKHWAGIVLMPLSVGPKGERRRRPETSEKLQ